jgi:hypothetical protein
MKNASCCEGVPDAAVRDMTVLVLLLALLSACRAAVEPTVAQRCSQVVRDFATVIRGEPGDKEAHSEALYVLSARLSRLRTTDEDSVRVDDAIDTLRKMRHCDGSGRVGKW